MPRSLDTVHAELIRVAQELGMNPKSREFTRARFLRHGTASPLVDAAGDSTDVSKHDLESYGGFTKLKQDAAHVAGLGSHLLQPEARGVDLRNAYVRKLEREHATTEYYITRIEEALQEAPPIKVPKSSFTKSRKKKDSTLTLLWSDLHFGVDVQSYEVYGSVYNWQIAARRLSKLCKEAVEWEDDLSRTKLRVVLNGDIMQGVIHLSDANIKPMTEQIWGATSLLVNAISFLRQHFSEVEVVCLPGNHDRMTYKDNNRQLAQRWDSHAHSIFLGLKLAFQSDTGVTLDVPTSGIALMDDMNGGFMLASHGDVEPDPKNVSKKINTERMATQLLKIKQSQAIEKNISVALFGHWHTPTLQMLPTGSYIVVNGCLIGSEPFGQNAIGEFNNQPAQVMLESVEGNPVNRFKVVQVRCADDDESLDEVIPTPVIISEGQLVL